MKVIKVLYCVVSLPVVLLGMLFSLIKLDFRFGNRVALEMWKEIR